MSLQVRYHALKTVVNLMGLVEWLAGGYGLLSFYSKDSQGWQLAILVLAISYLLSCELGYLVNRWQIRLELKNNKQEE